MSRPPERYISTAPVQVGPMLAPSDMYNKYNQMFSEIEQTTRPIAQSLADQNARENGQIAGENPGFKTTFEFGEASKVYNEAGLAANKVYTQNKIDKAVSELKLQALGINPDGSLVMGPDGKTPRGLTTESMSEMNAGLQALGHGILSGVPLENRSAVTQYLSAKSTMAQSTLLTKLYTKEQNDNQLNLQDNFHQKIGSLSSDISNAYSQPLMLRESAIKMANNNFGATLQNSEKAMLAAGVPVKTIESLKDQAKLRIYTANQLGIIHNMPIDQAMQHAKDEAFNPDIIGQFGNSTAKSISNTLIGSLKARFNAEGVTNQQIDAIGKTLPLQAFNNPTSPVDQVQFSKWETHQILNGKEGNIQDKENEISIARQYGSVVQNALSGNWDQIGAAQQELSDEKSNLKYNNPDDLKRLTWINAAQQKLSAAQTALTPGKNYNPVPLITQTAGYQALQQKIAENSGVMGGQTGIQDEQNYIRDFQVKEGIDPHDVKLMSRSESSSYAAAYSTGNQFKRNQILNQIAQIYGPNTGLAFQQIQSENKIPGMMTLFNSSINPETQPKVQMMTTALMVPKADAQEVFKKQDIKWQDAMDNIASYASDTTSLYTKQVLNDPTVFKPQLEAAAYIASYEMKNNGKDYDTACKDAADLTFNDHTTSGSLNGQDFAIPKYDVMKNPIDASRVPAALKLMLMDALKNGIQTNPNYPRNGLSEEQTNQNYEDDLRGQFHIQNTMNGWAIMDSLNQVARRSDGTPLILKTSQLADMYSPINEELNARIATFNKGFQDNYYTRQYIGHGNNPDSAALKSIENTNLFKDRYGKRFNEYSKQILNGLKKNTDLIDIQFGRTKIPLISIGGKREDQ